MQDASPTFDVVVIGCGAAGLSAALSAVQARPGLRVSVLERTARADRGGSTRWTGAYMRLADPYTVAPNFVDDMVAFSGGRSDRHYVETLVDLIPETMEWVQEQGLRFRAQPTIFLTRSRPRLLPEGGGEQIVARLAERAEALGVEFCYQTTAVGLVHDDEGRIAGVQAHRDGRLQVIGCTAVVIACGGFEGNPEMLVQYLGPDADQLRNISEGGTHNKGEGIRMALAIGAKPSGEYGSFHAEPIDPRSVNPEPVVMVFPYGIMVNSRAERFVDEADGTADETYEHVARQVWAQPGHTAYFIGDQRLTEVPNRQHALLTEKPAITAGTVAELADMLALPSAALVATIAAFNAAASRAEQFTPTRPDGNATRGLAPPKSNWAHPLDRPPYLAYPMSCAIVFTYGGIATDTDARVLTADDVPIPGLFAAGECTGLYYGKYPGATSVLRSLVFGRVAGRNAAALSERTSSAATAG